MATGFCRPAGADFSTALVSQHRLEVGEGRVGRRVRSAIGNSGSAPRGFELALVLVVVAVETEQLPVAAVGRVVLVIVVAVMHSQFAQVAAGEFAGTAAADPWVDFQGLFAIALIARVRRAAGIGDDAVELA